MTSAPAPELHIGIDARGIGLMQDDSAPHRAALGRGAIAFVL